MTITLELLPDVEASLTAQAQAQGLQLSTYLQLLLEQHAAAKSPEATMSLEELEARLDAMAEGQKTCLSYPQKQQLAKVYIGTMIRRNLRLGLMRWLKGQKTCLSYPQKQQLAKVYIGTMIRRNDASEAPPGAELLSPARQCWVKRLEEAESR